MPHTQLQRGVWGIVTSILNILAPLTLQRETGYNTTSPPCSVCPRPKSHCHVLSETQENGIKTLKFAPTKVNLLVSSVHGRPLLTAYCCVDRRTEGLLFSFRQRWWVVLTQCWKICCGSQRAKYYFTLLHTYHIYTVQFLSVCK